jgi:uncharacterized protein (DUF1499 family)
MLTGLAVLLGLVVAGLGLRLYLGRAAESRLAPDEIVDFAARNSAGRSNIFASCPPGFCTPAADMASPVFRMSWERLRDAWATVIATQPRVERVAWDEGRRRASYIERSALLRFPDIVTVAFVPIGADRASLAIDSRSRYGKADFGVNRRRVEAWLGLLRQRIGQDEVPSAASPMPDAGATSL